MKPFTFRLESVLAMRAREESQAREAFGAALRYKQECEQDLHEGNLELEAAQDAISDLRGKSSSGTEQMLLIRAWRWTSESVQRLEIALQSAAQTAEQKRELFLAARQRHQAMEKLKEKQRQEHATLVLRHQESELADFITARHGRASALA